jgi:peptide/nickel transport system substrate-binding protein
MRRALRRHGTVGHGTLTRVIGRRRRGRKLAGWGAPVAVALAVTGCATATAPAGGHTPVYGGVATYAENPATQPAYIFPFDSPSYFSIVNTDDLQYLMYRPLYWYGGAGEPTLNEQLSLAYKPTYKGNVVTIRLKHYMWSNGEQVSAQDVVFWMNMMKTEAPAPHYNWGGYVPGYFPDNVKSYRAVTPTEVQLRLTTSTFSHTWFDNNELSQITPMPQAWDVTKQGRSDCTTRISDCAAVYQYLDSQAGNPPSWPHSSLWSVVDGPWRLTGYSSTGVLTFQFNRGYSGQAQMPKDHITTFVEVPFTSEEAEYNVLQAQGRNTLDVGYLPTVDASLPQPDQSVGQNPVSGYQLQALYTWGLSYAAYNFESHDPMVAVFSQQYFRTAFQDLVNQSEIIQGPLHGYGKLTTGVVGAFPRTMYMSAKEKQGDPYPYNPYAAKTLLLKHGWDVSLKTTTCVRPGTGPDQCGSGVPAQKQLSFTIMYVTGLAWLEAELLQLKENALQLGMHITLQPMNFQDLISRAFGDCGKGPKPHGKCPWAIADWGSPGWSYSPDFLPTGEDIFKYGAGGNIGSYDNPTNENMIDATLRSSNLHLMWQWEDYLTRQLPVVLQPDAPYQLVESIDSLRIGVQSPTLSINPEDWYYVR